MSIVIQPEEIIAVLRQFNPWWSSGDVADLPHWERPMFRSILDWAESPQIERSLLLIGPRQVGKTTLFRQAIRHLLQRGVPAENVLYATFDHPLLKLIGQERVMQIWREYVPRQKRRDKKLPDFEYLFFDELQFMEHWGTWLKHETDFNKTRRIAATGSAVSLLDQNAESGVGRWLTLKLPTLSFYEYLLLRKENPLDDIVDTREGQTSNNRPNQNPKDGLSKCSLREFAGMLEQDRMCFAEIARKLTPYFHEYLIRGGFPGCAKIEEIPVVQRLLREDIVDKILKRDMTALFGVRQVLQLEQLFLYLCLHDGSIFDFAAVCDSLNVKRPTIERYLSFFEATHLLSRLRPFGYGKEVLRGRYKFYLADPSIATAVFLRGREPLENATQLGSIVESTVYKHLAFESVQSGGLRFSYWKGKNDREVDLVLEEGEKRTPFEIKYRSREQTTTKYIRGLLEFCKERAPDVAYVITKEPDDLDVFTCEKTKIVKIPASLACYLLGQK